MSADNNELVCPIMLEPIDEAFCTCFGFIYERRAIEDWLRTRDTEPMTGEVLPTLKIHRLGKVSPGAVERIKTSAKEIGEQTRRCLKGRIGSVHQYHHTEIFYRGLLEQKKIINQLPFGLWKSFLASKRDMFICNYKTPYGQEGEAMESDEGRPAGTGIYYQHIKLSFITKSKTSFKGDHFDGANMTACQFIDCDFGNVTFVGAKLEGCHFIRCSFVGDRNSFYKSEGKPVFIDCKIEPVGVWCKVDSLKEVSDCLRQRGLETFEIQKTV